MKVRDGWAEGSRRAGWRRRYRSVVKSVTRQGAVALAIAAAALVSAHEAEAWQAADDATGSWTARVADDGTLRLELSRWDREGSWRSSVSLDPDEARDILASVRRSDGVADFRIDREAGTLSFQGRLRDGRGMGEFRFAQRPEFRQSMRDLGYVGLDDDQVFAAALLDVGPRHARSMTALGFSDLDFDELVSSRIFDVDADYLAEMDAVGFGDLDFDQLVSFRVFGIDGETVLATSESRLGPLDADDIVAMKVHGITAGAVDDALGLFDDASFDDVVAMRIHGITPEFVRAADDLGFGSLDLDDVMAMKIHGLTNAYLASMSDVGVDLDDFDEAIAFRVHGIDADFVRDLREEGFSGLDNDALLRIRIHGLDEILRKRRRSVRR
jgi:hypothetical protein